MHELVEEALAGKARPIYLIEGDEYLARTSARELAEALVPEKDRALNLVVLDASAGVRDVTSHLVTVAGVSPPHGVVVEGGDPLGGGVGAAPEQVRPRELVEAPPPPDAPRAQ